MLTAHPLSIIIADDHPSICYGITSILQNLEFIKQVDCASNGIEVLKLLNKNTYDVIIMDIKMPHFDGLETTETVLKIHPKIKIIGLSMYTEEHDVNEMLKRGASGYLHKNANREEIIRAILAVHKGETYISEYVSSKTSVKKIEPTNVIFDIHDPHDACLLEILFLLSYDFSTKEIAHILNYSVRTVEAYRSQLSKRLGVRGLAGIINYAVDGGLRNDPGLKAKFEKQIKKQSPFISD